MSWGSEGRGSSVGAVVAGTRHVGGTSTHHQVLDRGGELQGTPAQGQGGTGTGGGTGRSRGGGTI